VAVPERGPRIVNPLKQSVELDPEGNLIRRWLPNLAEIKAPLIHTPWVSGGKPPIVEVERAMRCARAIWPLKHGLPSNFSPPPADEKQPTLL
jgi:deoxyribodipyrimidine photolyase